MDDFKRTLKQQVWIKEEYYQIAKEGLKESNHEGMRVLQNYASKVDSILDLGCGEGTRLSLLSKEINLTGVDISETAIKMAKKNYPKITFIKADLEKVPLKGGSFQLVYSAYVLEHLTNPEKVLSEAIRLLRISGFLVLIAPNYGAPNRASPPFKGSRFKKLFLGLVKDFLIFFRSGENLNWFRVKPIADNAIYEVDWDTTIEPYINTLIHFLLNHKMKIEYLTTCWSEELPNAKIHQKIFRFLGEVGMYPFLRWGPHSVVVARKVKDES